MSEGRRGERGRKVVASRAVINESSRLRDDDEALCPGPHLSGLHHDIILNQIVPKLPWRTFFDLSSVSRGWRQAIQSREVYDARVRCRSTEAHVVLNHVYDKDNVFSLYSVRDHGWNQLPQFPKCHRSQREVPIPRSCQCVSLDGKIYVLVGEKHFAELDSDDEDDKDERFEFDDEDKEDDLSSRYSSELYVLDLAGQREWKQCASMPQPRYAFGCGVLDGKIYVCGGLTSPGEATCESIVYDPKENAWSSITPMTCKRSRPHVIAVGEELFVHGGKLYVEHEDRGLSPEREFVDIFHPGKAVWRTALLNEPFWCHIPGGLFTAQGKLHMLTPRGIYGHHIDSDGNFSWTPLQSMSFADVDPKLIRSLDGLDVCATQAVNNELLALLAWASYGKEGRPTLYQSKGFGRENENISWEIVSRDMSKDRHDFMCAVQL